MDSHQIEAYCTRIGLSNTPKADLNLDFIKTAIWSHQRAVPFENLDIHYGGKIVLDRARIFNKIVHERRGGFCYELNGTFFDFLKSIGYDVEMLSGRVVKKDGITFPPEYDHLTILLKFEGLSYLVDVGMGDFSRDPVPIGDKVEHNDGTSAYFVDKYDNQYYLVKKREAAGDFKKKYLFSLTPRRYDEFADRCHWQQTNPDSHFIQIK